MYVYHLDTVSYYDQFNAGEMKIDVREQKKAFAVYIRHMRVMLAVCLWYGTHPSRRMSINFECASNTSLAI